jgi:serine/threonine-protein kinase
MSSSAEGSAARDEQHPTPLPSEARSDSAPSEGDREPRGDSIPSESDREPRGDSIPIEHESDHGSVEVPVGSAGPESAAIEPSRPRRRRVRGFFILIALAVAAFSTGLLIFNNAIMPRLIHSVGEVRVPDLANLTLEQGEKALRPLGLQLSRAGERFDPSVPRGFILSQDPAPETPVRGRRRVLVVVSLGEEFSSVPSLFGESMRTAQYLLERAGLRMGAITRAPSDEVGDGLVVATDPPGESVLARETSVSLLVSTGAGEESFVMPDLLGREITGARRQLESLGFRVFTPPAAPSHGTIVFQEPAPGSRIARNTTIVLQATGRMIR